MSTRKLKILALCLTIVFGAAFIVAPRANAQNQSIGSVLGDCAFILVSGSTMDEWATTDLRDNITRGFFTSPSWTSVNAHIDINNGTPQPLYNVSSGWIDEIGFIGLLSSLIQGGLSNNFPYSVTVVPCLAVDNLEKARTPDILDICYYYEEQIPNSGEASLTQLIGWKSFDSVFTTDDGGNFVIDYDFDFDDLYSYVSNTIMRYYTGSAFKYFSSKNLGPSVPVLSFMSYIVPAFSFETETWGRLMDEERGFISPILNWVWTSFPFVVFVFGALLVGGVLVSLIK